MKRILLLALPLLIVALAVAPSWAQIGDWPDWVFTPDWPPGNYPVWDAPNIFGLETQWTLTVNPDGTFGIGGYNVRPDYDGFSYSCLNADCSELMVMGISYIGGAWGDAPFNFSFVIRRSDWAPILNPTPTALPGTSTPVSSTATPPPATPTPNDTTCPSDIIQQAPPRAERVGSFPPNPVVRGQGGQGLTITYRVTSFPVVRHWWEKVDNSHWGCVHVESGFEDDGRYGVSPCAAGWEGWETRWISDVKCEERIQIIPDPIRVETFQAHARLRESSKRWIEGELQQRYPGARVRRPNWDVAGRVQTNGCAADGRCILVATVYFPFEDPGWYDIWAEGQTSGTPYTPPRTFRYQPSQPQAVYLMDSTLLPDW